MWFFIADGHSTMQFKYEFISLLAECQKNFHLPEHIGSVLNVHILFTFCNKLT